MIKPPLTEIRFFTGALPKWKEAIRTGEKTEEEYLMWAASWCAKLPYLKNKFNFDFNPTLL